MKLDCHDLIVPLTSFQITSADQTFSSTGLVTIQFFQNVTISASSRQAFYVTMSRSNAYVYYGAQYAEDASSIVIQNEDLAIHRGTANAYPFGGYLAPRYWNGALIYQRK